MDTYSKHLQDFLNINSMQYIAEIHKNERKKTSVIIVENEQDKYILKIIDESTPIEIKDKFYNEVDFYKNHNFSFIPKYFQNTETILQIEYLESCTFRDILIKDNTNLEIISNLFDSTFSLYDNCNKKSLESNFVKAFSHLGALAASGPMQTKDMKVSFVDKFFNRILVRILKYRMKNIIKTLDLTKLKAGFSHGDMHYNNILITESQEVKQIDFENISYKGYYDFDLIYLFVMTELYLSEKKYTDIKESVISKICKDEKNLFGVIKLYRIAVSSNKRFHVGLDLNISKLQILINALSHY